MRSIQWLTFYMPDKSQQTRLHFFPASPIAATPFPVDLSVTIFGRYIEPKRMTIDGARMFQPDGMRLEDVFQLPDQAAESPFGLLVEISCPQPRADVSASSCMMEIMSADGFVRYKVPPIKQSETEEVEQEEELERCSLLMRDSYFAPSIVVVNATDSELKPQLMSFSTQNPDGTRELIPVGQLGPWSVLERKLEGVLFSNVEPEEFSWGLMRARTIVPVGLPEQGVSCYVMYRDAKINTIQSIRAI